MSRSPIVDRTEAAPWAVCGSRLLLGITADEDGAVAVFGEYVDCITEQPGTARRRVALVCRGEVLREWDSAQ